MLTAGCCPVLVGGLDIALVQLFIEREYRYMDGFLTNDTGLIWFSDTL
jgi:hypothetical protein